MNISQFVGGGLDWPARSPNLDFNQHILDEPTSVLDPTKSLQRGFQTRPLVVPYSSCIPSSEVTNYTQK